MSKINLFISFICACIAGCSQEENGPGWAMPTRFYLIPIFKDVSPI